MDFLRLLKERYTCKHYDPDRRVPDETMDRIRAALVLTPSAVNIQSWHFYEIASPQMHEKFAATMSPANLGRYQACSHVLVLAAKTHLNEDDYRLRTERDDACGRYGSAAIREEEHGHRRGYAEKFNADPATMEEWAGKQVYIALATALYMAAAEGVDSTPVEGFNAALADEILDLAARGEHAEVCVFFGYRKDDTNELSRRPKGRLGVADVFTKL